MLTSPFPRTMAYGRPLPLRSLESNSTERSFAKRAEYLRGRRCSTKYTCLVRLATRLGHQRGWGNASRLKWPLQHRPQWNSVFGSSEGALVDKISDDGYGIDCKKSASPDCLPCEEISSKCNRARWMHDNTRAA